jgi:p-hydroxybenzoate 3-monooxygenase
VTARTQVGIVGAGPAGLLLSHLLHLHGIESVVLEDRDRAYVEARVRAGVLEHGTVEILREAGVAERLDREGLPHEGISLQFAGARHRVPMTELTGRHITVYGQQEVVKDLVARRLADRGDVRFEVADVRVGDLQDQPRLTWADDAGRQELVCDVVVGCDGFHGVTRGYVGARELDRTYPFTWLGILAHAAPAVDELVYSLHERGFALYSMRSPEVSRLYLQVPAEAQLEDWPVGRIWDELDARLSLPGSSWAPTRGEALDVSLAPMRSVVLEPMQRGRLFLAGDSAHIVPPTGAKGLNLAVHDVWLLSRALDAWFARGDDALLESYTRDALRRVWRAQHFSWWMTSMLHRQGDDPFQYGLQLGQLDNVVSSRAYATALAENYVG